MKGLLAILGKGPPPKGGGPMPDDESSEPMPDSESSEGEGGDAKEYAKLVVDAIKDGDDAGASDALVSLVHACMTKHGDM